MTDYYTFERIPNGHVIFEVDVAADVRIIGSFYQGESRSPNIFTLSVNDYEYHLHAVDLPMNMHSAWELAHGSFRDALIEAYETWLEKEGRAPTH